MEEIIDEPFLDASHCSFVNASSELIQYYYKMKYPDTYSLSSSTVLKLLDNKQVYSDLRGAVSSFVEHAQKLNKGTTYCEAEKESTELPVYDTNWGAFSANSEESLFKKPSNLFPVSSPSTSVPMYDSVHSIKVPLRTYDSKSRAKLMPYRNHRRCETTTKRKCPTVAEVTKQMSGLVFDRVEKSVSFPLYKTGRPTPSVQKRDECLSISPSTRLQSNDSSDSDGLKMPGRAKLVATPTNTD